MINDFRYLWQHYADLLIAYKVIAITIAFCCMAFNAWLLQSLRHVGIPQANHQTADWVRWAAVPKPAIGGIGFSIAFLLGLLTIFLLLQCGISIEIPNWQQWYSFIAACALGFLVGLIDDMRQISPRYKLAGQLLCAVLLLMGGIVIPISDIMPLNALFTIGWVVGIMNSLNMLDNMDGITASVSLFILLGILTLAALDGQMALAFCVIAVAMLGGLLGFLHYNWHPSRMFMGDAGSQLLGVLLAALSIIYVWHFRDTEYGIVSLRQLLLPALLFLLPIIDTTTVTVRRLWRGQSPSVGGRDHTTHHLAYCGLSDAQVALVFVALSALHLCLVYYVHRYLFPIWQPAYTLLLIAYMILLFILIQVADGYGKRKKARTC